MIKAQLCALPPEGARVAASRILVISSSGTGSGFKRRKDRAEYIASNRPISGIVAATSAQIDRVAFEQLERDHLEGRFMRRRQSDLWRFTGLERLFPALGAQAPAIARLETGKAEGRHRRRQIVAGLFRKSQKRGIDLGAHRVHPEILGSGVAAAVAIKSGHRLRAAFGERLAENIAWIGHRKAPLRDRFHAGRRSARSASRASIASQIFGAISTPSSRAISWMPVGEVTLISVSQSPITSMPTKTSPWARRVGPIAAQISRSRARSAVRSGRAPTCRLARASPSGGTRMTAPMASPSTRMMRLSPWRTAGT